MEEEGNERRRMLNLGYQRNHHVGIRVLTYNILADNLAKPEWHIHCPQSALKWEYRWPRIFKDIMESKPDVICLQEVQVSHFRDYIYPTMCALNYRGVLLRKDIPWIDSELVDGCATFYRADVFYPEKFYTLRLDGICRIPEADGYSRKMLQKGNIALGAKLTLYQTGHSVCVVNTHLTSRPENSDVKLLQAFFLAKSLEVHMASERNMLLQPIPLVICGDFNSLPGSAVHEFMKKGTVSANNKDLAQQSFQLQNKLGKLRHSLNLSSAYSALLSSEYQHIPELAEQVRLMDIKHGEPEFTTLAADRHRNPFKGTIDYIWYSPSTLQVGGLLELLSEGHVSKPDIVLPSREIPSDHLALAADLIFL